MTIFDAAASGRRLRMWKVPSVGPNVSTLGEMYLIRARARDQARNNPYAATALDKLVANGVGTGIQATGQWGDEAFQKRERALWERFMRSCDADGVFDFYGLQALVWRERSEAGEVFVRLRNRRPEDGLPVPLQLQVIESEQVPCGYHASALNGNVIRAGIEFDGIGRRVAYWMHREHPGDAGFGTGSTDLVRVPADQVLHVYRPQRAGQLRGLPDVTPALMRMFNLDRFSDNVLERQAIANLFAGFFVKKKPDGDTLGPMGPSGPLSDEAAVQSQIPGSGDNLSVGLEPATMAELPDGWDVKFTEPPGPGADYDDFMRHGLLSVAATYGVPYEVLTGDLRDVSDRALRLILNEFRRLIEMWQWLVFIPQFCQRVREAYLDAAVLHQILEIPGYGAIREDVARTLWVPQGWPYSHPVQDVEADIKAIRAGLVSRSATVLSNGEIPEEVDAQIAADNARADQHGLVFDSDARRTSTAGSRAADEAPQA